MAIIKKKGFALMTVLIITIIMVMLVSSMVIINLFNMSLTSSYKNRIKTLELSRSALAYTTYLFSKNMGYSQDFNSKAYTGDDYFEVTFNPKNKYYSVNNLLNNSSSSVKNFRGETVPANVADLVFVSRSANFERKVHAVIRHGINTKQALICMGQINLKGDCTIKGIKNLAGNIEIPGSIHSNFKTSKDGGSAIYWDGSGKFNLNKGGLVSCVPGGNPNSISDKIKDSVTSDQFNENYPTLPIPEIDILNTINNAAGLSYSLPPNTLSIPTGFKGTGQVNITGNNFIGGNYEVIGDLNLDNGTLYVKGDLKVTGTIRGKGSIYVSGNTKFYGDTSIVTDKESGATLFSEGDVEMEGIDAWIYLQLLANQDSNIKASFDSFKSQYDNVYKKSEEFSKINPTYSQVKSLFDSAHYLGRSCHPEHSFNSSIDYLVKGFKAPDGRVAFGDKSNGIVQLILSIENSSVGQKDPDKTAIVLKALNGICHNFRSGIYNKDSVSVWDDAMLPVELASFDRQFRSIEADITGNEYHVPPGRFKKPYSLNILAKNIKKYMDNNPLNNDFDAASYFQGVVYTKGKIKTKNKIGVIGVVLSHDDVELSNGSTLIYDEEYCNFSKEAPPVFKIVSWEEI